MRQWAFFARLGAKMQTHYELSSSISVTKVASIHQIGAIELLIT